MKFYNLGHKTFETDFRNVKTYRLTFTLPEKAIKHLCKIDSLTLHLKKLLTFMQNSN